MNTLYTLLRCPDCGGSFGKTHNVLICRKCRKAIRMVDGIVRVLDNDAIADAHNAMQREYYDREYVSEYANTQFEWRKRYIRRIQSYLPKRRPSVILDAACGQGYMTLALAQMGYKVIACDLSIEGLYRASRVAKKLHIDHNILFVATDITVFRMKDRSLDAALMLHVLEHMRNDDTVIRHIAPWCKRLSAIVVGVPLAFRYVFPLFIPIYMYSDRRVGHFRHYALEDLRRLFGNGYRVLRVYYTGHVIKLIGAVLSMLRVSKFERIIEDLDERQIDSKFWASNLMAIFQKK